MMNKFEHIAKILFEIEHDMEKDNVHEIKGYPFAHSIHELALGFLELSKNEEKENE